MDVWVSVGVLGRWEIQITDGKKINNGWKKK
jgi:hypothetical protein